LTRAEALSRLREREPEIRALGIECLSLFGSTARDEAEAGSDVDLAARLDRTRRIGAFEYLGVEERLQQLLGVKVDLVTEPARKSRLQAEIDRDRVVVF
jgi:uncharacterized protein